MCGIHGCFGVSGVRGEGGEKEKEKVDSRKRKIKDERLLLVSFVRDFLLRQKFLLNLIKEIEINKKQ